MNDLLHTKNAANIVECLGMTFPSEDVRREHFLGLLAEKLKDPSFRNQEGFPQGSDEAILAMSDPPYYTACPNPFLEKVVRCYGSEYESTEDRLKDPFVADVSEGKNDTIYNAHGYHTKVPHKAIVRYLLHYTKPGDVIFDGFCGSGMTGVAAQLCADASVVASLGYRVDGSGAVLEARQDDGRTVWQPISAIGKRQAILTDLSPAATFISHNYNNPPPLDQFDLAVRQIVRSTEDELGWMYQTRHIDGTTGRINYTVWSDVFTCPECAGEVIYWDVALDHARKKVLDEFSCPHCSFEMKKRALERAWTSTFDEALGTSIQHARQVPVLINYSVGSSRFEKRPDEDDLEVARRVSEIALPKNIPTNRMMEGREARRNDSIGMTHTHHYFTHRTLQIVSSILREAESYQPTVRSMLKMAVMDCFSVLTKMSRFRAPAWFDKSTGPMKGWTAGTLYVPSLQGEQNVLNAFAEKSRMIARSYNPKIRNQFISTGHSGSLTIPDQSIDYIFLDPPFGANISYSELNFLWESWLGVTTNAHDEAVENKSHGKGLDEYRKLMTQCFREAHRVLKPGRWMTVEFSNTKASVWNAIQTALQEAGFVVANISALDKKQGSFKAVTTTTAVKQDLVISAYKPNGGLEERFTRAGGSEASVWDFVRTHLEYLPTVKMRSGSLEFINERDPRIIFDRMVSWFVRHNVPVPLSSQEFQEGLAQRFSERDGMVFLSEQANEYDRKRARVASAPQMEMFISDERSAIDWLTDFLRNRPSTYQEIHPEFMSLLGAGWKKHEEKPELSALLEDNFLRCEGNADVPSQIHSYLSTNFKDLRGLEKDDPRLKAKAKDRWYVPDPSKAKDLEQKRERSLLKEFEGYKNAPGRRLKEFRLEVLRAGFKTAWAARDYKTIIGIAHKIPDEALQEDEKLLLWYDQALTRMEANA
ncbi:DNA methyltransferase [Roseovarius autotrophicus]|uniref:DNA methyltransferase n=1 Tax=Roseovarius autotrophicus TaxID=2824121 RepID=UPI001B36DE95|nr:DNA methyltransferase [Roseovarius autotrophicus]